MKSIRNVEKKGDLPSENCLIATQIQIEFLEITAQITVHNVVQRGLLSVKRLAGQPLRSVYS